LIHDGFVDIGPATIYVLDFEEVMPNHSQQMLEDLVHSIMIKAMPLMKEFVSAKNTNLVPLFKRRQPKTDEE
jgi:hypothetical protein